MRENNIIITIDYETWQPIPEGYVINWKEDLIENTNYLMETCEQVGAKLTLMVEMCEYFWLLENELKTAKLIEDQLKDAVKRGHDVQLHLHPNWMPELDAKYENGSWYWNWDFGACNDYPYDLAELFALCKNHLESIINEVKSDYTVKAFRAGAYRVQPFERISDALVKNGINIDTSIYRGGKSKDRGYDFSKCRSFNRPYKADMKDPQNSDDKNSPVIELPITTYRKGERWFLDNDEADVFGSRFINLNKKYFEQEKNYFVLIGHSKGKHNYKGIEEQLRIISSCPNTKFSTISECAESIRESVNLIDKNGSANHSIQEVQEIMEYLYNIIEPENDENCDRAEEILKRRKALCYGYAITLYKILKLYGYKVKCLTACAGNMPKGRGSRKLDTHEIVELKLNKKYYLLDCTTNTIIPYKIGKVLKNPALAAEKAKPDDRYIDREYFYYDTSFFYKRVVYYIKRRGCKYKMQGETILQNIGRRIYNLIYHIETLCRIYNIYRKNTEIQ